MNTTHTIIQKRLVYPLIPVSAGNSRTLAAQLDATLLKSGFKLSADLLTFIAKADFESAIGVSRDILAAVKELIGDHVKHNPYFARFPKDVPDTLEFWWDCIRTHYEATGELTTLLAGGDTSWHAMYGRHLHTFEDIVGLHDKLILKKSVKLKVVHLGRDLATETIELYRSLAGSAVPLNEADRALVAELLNIRVVIALDVEVPVRENRAIIGAFMVEKGLPYHANTLTDVLRVACQLSKGDVTLTEPTRFVHFKRGIRRALLAAMDAIVTAFPDKVEDVLRYREAWKRLARELHPSEFALFKGAQRAFDVAGGREKLETFGSKAHAALVSGGKSGDFTKAVTLLKTRPGTLVRHADLILRAGKAKNATALTEAIKDGADGIAGRNLMGLQQHLLNRSKATDSRVFVNRKGRGFSMASNLNVLPKADTSSVRVAVSRALASRVSSFDHLVVDWDSIEGIAAPLSEKSKSEGFAVLPRGSVVKVPHNADNGILRFFVYWRQKAERTDYDLSVVTFDDEMNSEQCSWTNLRYGGGAGGGVMTHSGDFTSAEGPEGATEFIDVRLDKLAANVRYVIPTVNVFSGECYKDADEAFFGFMQRPTSGKGMPFDARTVKTKFALTGESKVALPLVFVRTDAGWVAKWLDIYCKGQIAGNRVEATKFSTLGLAKSIIEKEFYPLTDLVKLYADRATKVTDIKKLPKDKPVTFIGMYRPEGLHPDSQVYTLERFKELIPA